MNEPAHRVRAQLIEGMSKPLGLLKTISISAAPDVWDHNEILNVVSVDRVTLLQGTLRKKDCKDLMNDSSDAEQLPTEDRNGIPTRKESVNFECVTNLLDRLFNLW